jgi:hypothetical protein
LDEGRRASPLDRQPATVQLTKVGAAEVREAEVRAAKVQLWIGGGTHTLISGSVRL